MDGLYLSKVEVTDTPTLFYKQGRFSLKIKSRWDGQKYIVHIHNVVLISWFLECKPTCYSVAGNFYVSSFNNQGGFAQCTRTINARVIKIDEKVREESKVVSDEINTSTANLFSYAYTYYSNSSKVKTAVNVKPSDLLAELESLADISSIKQDIEKRKTKEDEEVLRETKKPKYFHLKVSRNFF